MFLKQRKHRLQNASIRSIIFMYFTITALAASIFIGVSLYGRLSGQMSSALQEENRIPSFLLEEALYPEDGS